MYYSIFAETNYQQLYLFLWISSTRIAKTKNRLLWIKKYLNARPNILEESECLWGWLNCHGIRGILCNSTSLGKSRKDTLPVLEGIDNSNDRNFLAHSPNRSTISFIGALSKKIFVSTVLVTLIHASYTGKATNFSLNHRVVSRSTGFVDPDRTHTNIIGGFGRI